MSTHPYIPLYVDDYDAATTHLTPEEDGVYGRLLRLCWRTPSCSLPTDHAWIARKIRLTAEDFERVGRPVLEEFFTPFRSRLIQRRLKAEYDNISRKKSARVAAGKKGGSAKAAKAKDNPASNAIDLPAHMRASPEPYPDPVTEEGKPSSAATRGSRLSADWSPDEGGVAYALNAGFQPAQVDRIAERFRNYWLAKTGKDATKRDWPATWRNWVLTEAERQPPLRAVKGGVDWIG